MKIKTLLLGCAFTLSSVANAQLSGNLEFSINKFKKADRISFGGSLQYLLYRDDLALPGFNVGALYEIDNENNADYLSVPMNLQYRKYFIGSHGDYGGLYVEGMGGVKIRLPIKNTDRVHADTQYLPQASLGVGVRFPMTYDLNFRVGTYLLDGKLLPIIGFKFGYTFR